MTEQNNHNHEDGAPHSHETGAPHSHEAGAPHNHKKGTPHTISKMLLAKAARFEDELIAGHEAVESYPKTVTFFGSARFTEENEHYQKAREVAAAVCRAGYTVITGGGGGIMEAGNIGSKDACDCSVGFNIELPHEQALNPNVTHGVNFEFFASRKMSMYFSGEAFIFFAGGFGTLDEFFQILTLMQTHKAPEVPVICVGSSYWNPIDATIKEVLRDQDKTISPEDIDLYTITDDVDEVIRLIKKSPTA